MSLSPWKSAVVFVSLVLLSFSAGFYSGRFFDFGIKKEWFQQRQKGGYKFINPLLECEDIFDDTLPAEYKQMKKSLANEVDRLMNGSVHHISLYFRDLNNGDYYGFNEKEKFTPASLLKVPVMIAYLKLAERDPRLLDKEVVFHEKEDLVAEILGAQTGVSLVDGQKYTIEELIRIMIQESYNPAAYLLLDNIGQEELAKVFTELGLKAPVADEIENFMTVREYASFFRILYNATYLNKEMSEKALSILAGSKFGDGLVAGAPLELAVSHKFGVRQLEDVIQFHDCGVVYYPENPYLICIMTRGRELNSQTEAVRKLSKKVYGIYDRMKREGRSEG
ncbi:MAG: serine hydrolase [Patescibacteria group bacterium]